MLLGKRISDRYEIKKLIGGGGMANVYLAHDIILNRDVAIKILRYDFTNEEELHRRFQREALSATSLTHPNIVSIYDVGDDEDLHYIVMEYIKGKTLKQYIQEFSPLSPARAVHIMKQLTSAMAHAHEHGIIHRDIKPQNILVDTEGNVEITDFGIATTLSATSYTQTNSVIGTVHYISPEQARGGTASKKSDIYALGIVLYELLTGELPFSGESAVSIALKHLQAETPSVRAFDASIPQSVENIVLKATAKDAAHRYDSMEDMEADLATCLSLGRVNEEKFKMPIDNDATRVMPIIKEPKPVVEPRKPPVAESVAKVEPAPKTPGKKKKKWPLIIGGVIAVAILALMVMNMLSPSKVEVPDVKNLALEEAIKELEEAGFIIGEQEERNHEDIEIGNVIETNPSAGLEREKGTEVKIIVSLGEATDKMISYVGRPYEQISSMLAGFANTEVKQVYSDVAEGVIISQDPPAGEEIIAKNTTVIFEVSKGKKLETVTNLIGMNEANRSDYERSSGFKIKVASEEHSETVAIGNVIKQNPNAGAKLGEGATISVTISKGPAAKPVKFYTKRVKIPYEPSEEGLEQKVVIYLQDKKRSLADPYEEMVITESTSILLQFEIEEGGKAAYQVVRDNLIIENETIMYETLLEE